MVPWAALAWLWTEGADYTGTFLCATVLTVKVQDIRFDMFGSSHKPSFPFNPLWVRLFNIISFLKKKSDWVKCSVIMPDFGW